MRLRILTRYILKELFTPFLFSVCAFSGILLAMSFIGLLRLGEENGLTVNTILKLLFYLIPEKIALGIPMATLLATLLALGGLSGHSETTAMRAGGISFFRLAAPVLIVGFLVSVGNFFLNESLVPDTQAAFNAEKAKAVGQDRDTNLTNYFYSEYKGDDFHRLVYADSFNPATGKMTGVAVMEFDHKKLVRTIVAETLVWLDEGWYFQKGEIQNYRDNKVFPLKFDTGYIPSGIKASPKQMLAATKQPEEMSFWELARYIRIAKIRPEEKNKLLVDLHLKLALPFASFFFTLLGAPVGLQPQRRSVSTGFGLSIIFILIYYALFAVGSMIGRSGALPPFLGAWMQNLVLGGYGVYRFIKVKK